MKQMSLFGIAAVCAAIGLSSFNTPKSFGVYYFKVNTGTNKVIGTLQQYTGSQVTRIINVDDAGCPGIGDFDCVITFSTSVLTQTNFAHLIAPAVQRGTVAIKN